MSAATSKHRIPTLIFWTSAVLILIAAVAYEPFSAAGRQRRAIAAVKQLETELSSTLQANARFQDVEVKAIKDSLIVVRGHVADKNDAALLEAVLRKWNPKDRPAADVQVSAGSDGHDERISFQLERNKSSENR